MRTVVKTKKRFYERRLKRLIDVVAAVALIVVLWPVGLCVAVLILAFQRSRVFFVQKRIGLGGQVFSVIKFRTMLDAFDFNGAPLPDADRLTMLGGLLRKTSLDELPQLVNVLKGDMSLIGPRPLLVRYLPYYAEPELRRHDVRPGITGWAQIRGRNELCWDKRIAADIWYVDNVSFLLDLKIAWLTVLKVIVGSGVSIDTGGTLKDFDVERQKLVADKSV